jgi:rhodanese-related sulfurtransferase
MKYLISAILLTLALVATPAMSAVDKDAKSTDSKEAKPAESKAAAEYPHRTSFPDVAIVTTEDLARQFDKVTVVDVRSKYEFDTLHVKDAVNLPVTSKTFQEKVRELYAKDGKPLVFYCNGRTCKKSYDAARLATHAKVDKNFCYDAGIFSWAKANPDRTVLLGKSPIKPENLIEDKLFKERLLAAKDFESKVGPNAIVLDIRELVQRDTTLFPFREERVPLDQVAKIEAVLERAKAQNKTLLVYDKVGHQVQWFQYHIESKGIKNYYFLKGGSEGYYEQTLGVHMGLKKKP